MCMSPDVVAGNNAFDTSVLQLVRQFNNRPVVPYIGASDTAAAFHMNFGQNPTFNGAITAG